MNTAIYCRVSTEEQANDGFSIHAQKDKLTKYAEVNDWNIVDYYIDDGISGKNLTDRGEVLRLINDVRDGKINNVLVYKLDRITRSVKDLIYLIELFDKYDCTFNSQTEKIDTSNAVGRMFVKIIGIFAEFERENLAERVTLGYEQKTREGNYTNCNGVFGYDYLVGNGSLKINEYEALYVKKIFEWYLNGESMVSIANNLIELDIPTKRSGKWHASTIKSILTNPLYIGRVRYGVNKNNNFEVDGKDIEPIINKELFYSVNELIESRKKFYNKRSSSDDTYYFRVLRCGSCGSRFIAREQIKNNKKYITYRCINKECKAMGFSHKKMEGAFLKYLDNVEDFEYTTSIFDDNLEKLDKDRIVVERLKKKKNKVLELYLNEEIDHYKYTQLNNNIEKEITSISNDVLSYDIDNSDISRNIVNLKNNFINLTNHEKKMFLERFVMEIKVRKDDGNVVIDNVFFKYCDII